MTKMANRVQALEQKVDSAVPCTIHLLGMTRYSTSEEAVAAYKQANPGTQDDEFIVMVGLFGARGQVKRLSADDADTRTRARKRNAILNGGSLSRQRASPAAGVPAGLLVLE